MISLISHFHYFFFLNWLCILDWPGNYPVFYEAIKRVYPDIQIITNCDASKQPLTHPADLYDYHVIFNILTSTFSFICFTCIYPSNTLLYDFLISITHSPPMTCFTRLKILIMRPALVQRFEDPYQIYSIYNLHSCEKKPKWPNFTIKTLFLSKKNLFLWKI